MKEIIIIIVCVLLFLFFISRARKLKNQVESKLSVFEHPSTFEKPDIEMVSKTVRKGGFNENIKTIRIDYLNQERENEKY